MERRQTLRGLDPRETGAPPGESLKNAAFVRGEELEALASELEDEALALEPACAVACTRLFRDAVGSPLLNSACRGADSLACSPDPLGVQTSRACCLI